jgi:hypothetical protein
MKEQTTPLGTIKLTGFAMRHFDPEFGGTKILNLDPKSFEQYLNIFAKQYFEKPEERWIDKEKDILRVNILDGYAPFCKLLVMKNITDAKAGSLPITEANYQFLRSDYSARREDELAVSSRWFDYPPGIQKPQAEYTVSILYSKEQIDKEAMAMYNKSQASNYIDTIGAEPPAPFDADWGVVAILGQMHYKEEPMKPETMLRNYMPIEFGGSGMQFPKMPGKPERDSFEHDSEYDRAMDDYKGKLAKYQDEMQEFRDKYNKSVDFWRKNATVK